MNCQRMTQYWTLTTNGWKFSKGGDGVGLQLELYLVSAKIFSCFGSSQFFIVLYHIMLFESVLRAQKD